MSELKIIKVSNPNRLVKIAIKDHCSHRYIVNYIFNIDSGEIAEFHIDTFWNLKKWVRLTDNQYPIFNEETYIGYWWRGVFKERKGLYCLQATHTKTHTAY